MKGFYILKIKPFSRLLLFLSTCFYRFYRVLLRFVLFSLFIDLWIKGAGEDYLDAIGAHLDKSRRPRIARGSGREEKKKKSENSLPRLSPLVRGDKSYRPRRGFPRSHYALWKSSSGATHLIAPDEESPDEVFLSGNPRQGRHNPSPLTRTAQVGFELRISTLYICVFQLL